MTRYQAEQMAINLRAVGWPVSVEMNDDGTWRAVAEESCAARLPCSVLRSSVGLKAHK
jgi:hypothetical protein